MSVHDSFLKKNMLGRHCKAVRRGKEIQDLARAITARSRRPIDQHARYRVGINRPINPATQ